LLETERLDLVQETLIHEFTHLLGYHWHDEDFVGAYNTIFHEYLKDRANSSVVFETTAQINAIGDKYQQASVKIPSKDVKKLNLKKGQKITILLEKGDESKEKTNEIDPKDEKQFKEDLKKDLGFSSS
jgi:predicted DNA-binding antitoxin AbrB/MazE fold protein